MSVVDNWEEWKKFLESRLKQSEEKGMGEKAISEMAFQLGDFLAKHVQPKNDQERVLRDLWSVATKEEQHVLASLMIKLVEK